MPDFAEFHPEGRRMTYSAQERGMASVLFRPQRWGKDFPNYLEGIGFSEETLRLDSAERPAVLRMQAWGHQDDEHEFVYHHSPGNAPEYGGTACGGILYCLPGQDMVTKEGVGSVPGRPILTAHVVTGPGVWRGYGWPAIDTCDGMLSGSFREGYESGDLVTEWRDDGAWFTSRVIRRPYEPEGAAATAVPSGDPNYGGAFLWGVPDMHYVGQYAAGRGYGPGAVVVDGDWTMVALEPTNDRPAPQPIGSPAWVSGLGDTAPWSLESANSTEIITGQRYTFSQAGFLNGWRVWITAVNPDYEWVVMSVRDPLGTPTVTTQAISPTRAGWFTVPVGGETLPEGTVFDFMLITRNRASSSVFSGDWTYLNPQNPGTPTSGTIIHPRGVQSLIQVADLDDAAVDRSSELATVKPGDTIEAGGITWTVVSAIDQGTHFDFEVSPEALIPGGGGLYTFQFTVYAPQPTNYVRILNHYAGNPDVDGFYSETGYDNIVLDDNAYGADIEVQAAAISDDWGLVAYSSLGLPSAATSTQAVVARVDERFDYTTLSAYLTILRNDIADLSGPMPIAQWRDTIQKNLLDWMRAVERLIMNHFGDPPFQP